MTSALLAVLTVGFVGEPASDGKDLTDMRLTNRGLIVGTWELPQPDGGISICDFHRDGQLRVTVLRPNGSRSTERGNYRVDTERLTLKYPGNPKFTGKLVRLDRRVLVVHWEGGRVQRLRRR